MLLAISAPGASLSSGGSFQRPVVQAAVAQPFIQDTGPPPAAAARAERLFEYTGIALLLVLVVSVLMILIRRR